MSIFFEINNKLEFHYYGKCLQAHLGSNNFFELNELHYDILKECCGGHDKETIFKNLSEIYSFDVNDNEMNDLYETVLNDLVDNKIIAYSSASVKQNMTITGEFGKTYPFWIVCELTNRCCFSCPHCYKDADIEGEELNPMIFKKILAMFKGKSPHLVLTGGEPLLHQNINEFISSAYKDFKVHLLTNGYLLDIIDLELLKDLESIQISVYGYNNTTYQEFTNISNGADKLKHNILALNKLDIKNIHVSLMLTPDNITHLDSYIDFVSSLGIAKIGVGMAVPSGRALKNNNQLFKENLEQLALGVEKIKSKYKDIVKTISLQGISVKEKYNDTHFHCQAGKTSIVVSQSGHIRPCLLLPELEPNRLSIDDYFKCIINGSELDYNNYLEKISDNLKINGFQLSDMECVGFCKIGDLT